MVTMNTYVRLISLVFMACLLIAVGQGAFAQTSSFDPTICPGDHQGKLAVRLSSGLAFRMEPRGYMLGAHRPDPVDSNLPPWGCPGNPIETESISFLYRYEATLQNRYDPQIPEGRPSLLRIFGHDGPTRVQDGDLRAFERAKLRKDSCEVTEEGKEICRNCKIVDGFCFPQRREKISKRGIPSWARALPGTYHEWNGRPFITECSWGRPSHAVEPNGVWCTADYEMMGGLSVMYRFTDPKIPEDKYMAFDREIRRQILAARAPELDTPTRWRKKDEAHGARD